MSLALQHVDSRLEASVKSTYQYCGVVRDVSDFRRIQASFMLDFATDVIVARYHHDGKNRRIENITHIFRLLTEAKRKSGGSKEGKRIFIYRER